MKNVIKREPCKLVCRWPSVSILCNKKTIITILLAIVAMTGQAQTTKTATIKGYSPALKDSTVAECLIDMVRVASDTVQGGHFTMTVPVEKLTTSLLYLEGEGCPNYLMTLYLAPDATVSLTGADCLYPIWKVESPLPEQTTANRIIEHQHDALTELLQLELANVPWEKQEPVYDVMMKQQLDILPSLSTDMAVMDALEDIANYARNKPEYPYWEQLRAVEKDIAAHAPKGFEDKLAYIHLLVYPPHVLQPGDEAVDADFFDMQGNPHHLAELRGKYILLDFWSLGCGPCRMAEPEMRWVHELTQGQLEIVGINHDKPSAWQEDEWSKKLVWQNWSDGKMGKGGVNSQYCDNSAVPYYVLLSPDHHVMWKSAGYAPGMFLGMATSINGPKQDNSANLSFVVRQVEVNDKATSVSFRFYGRSNAWFRIASSSYLTANGKKYKVTGAGGITLDTEIYPNLKATAVNDGIMSTLHFTDFTLTFEPFDTMPATFDYKEGDGEGAFVIRNISLK